MNTWDYWRYLIALQMARLGQASSKRWPPFSRLMIARVYAGWSLDADAIALEQCCRKLAIPMASGLRAAYSEQQVVFFTDQFSLLKPEIWKRHRLTFAYFHGRPGTGLDEFDQVYECFKKNHTRFSRVQVSHSEMRDLVLATGVSPEKVKVIPIAVDARLFKPETKERKQAIRRHLGIPQSAFVVGSFQKDGVGWGAGMEPKLIKGPDVFTHVMERVKSRIPELFVLLSGPARGYVKKRLDAVGIPWRHVYFKHFKDLPPLYHALDMVLVCSRQEGGPKALLESMASGIPLVTTKVGQAMDLVQPGKNAYMHDVDDVQALAHAVEQVYGLCSQDKARLVAAGRHTAETHAWERQGPLWREFFKGVVE